jgi:hypothetical protein
LRLFIICKQTQALFIFIFACVCCVLLYACQTMKAEKSKFTGFRCPSELLTEIKKVADLEDRSMSNFIVRSLKKAVAQQQARSSAPHQHAA